MSPHLMSEAFSFHFSVFVTKSKNGTPAEYRRIIWGKRCFIIFLLFAFSAENKSIRKWTEMSDRVRTGDDTTENRHSDLCFGTFASNILFIDEKRYAAPHTETMQHTYFCLLQSLCFDITNERTNERVSVRTNERYCERYTIPSSARTTHRDHSTWTQVGRTEVL